MRHVLAVTLTLGLAACGKPAAVPPPAATPTAQTEAQADAAVGRSVTVDREPPPGVPNPAARSHTDPLDFPPAFQGHWGLTPADCDISRPDAAGLMKIDGKTLDFHDSRATVRAVTAHSPYRRMVDLDFKDDARTWQRREVLELELGGTHLLRVEPGGRYRYEHC